MSGQLITERDGRVVIVTLQNRGSMNALSADLRIQLDAMLVNLAVDSECGAILLRGADGDFCAGGDITEMRWRSTAEGRARMEVAHRIIRALCTGPKPVVAAVEGHAIGGGLSLALACDYVVVSRSAALAASFVPRVALLPDMGLMWTMTQRVGLGVAKRLLALGEKVTGQRAVELGLADEAVNAGGAHARALEVAREFAALPATAVHFLKIAMANRAGSLEQTLNAEADYQSVLFQSQDHAEAARAFLEKRRPVFKAEVSPPSPDRA